MKFVDLQSGRDIKVAEQKRRGQTEADKFELEKRKVQVQESKANAELIRDSLKLTATAEARIKENREAGKKADAKLDSDLVKANAKLEESLRSSFANETKDFRTIEDASEKIQNVAVGTMGGDLAMIFAYMKMTDPGSVVRESNSQCE